MKFIEKYDKLKPDLLKILQKFESMGHVHLGIITVANHQNISRLPNSPLVLSALHRAGFKQREFEQNGAAQMKHSKDAEPLVTEWASLIPFAPKMDGNLQFCVDN